MKKIIAAVLGAVMAVSLAGCRTSGSKLEKISTESAPDADTVKMSDYADNLEGLEKYLVDLNYIPQKSEATDMLASVIGAKSGHRYNFIVDRSTVIAELYEYDTDALTEEGRRVIDEVKTNGEFYVFDKNVQIDENTAYKADLSDSGKYLLIYTDNSSDIANVQRKADFTQKVKAFHSSEE